MSFNWVQPRKSLYDIRIRVTKNNICIDLSDNILKQLGVSAGDNLIFGLSDDGNQLAIKPDAGGYKIAKPEGAGHGTIQAGAKSVSGMKPGIFSPGDTRLEVMGGPDDAMVVLTLQGGDKAATEATSEPQEAPEQPNQPEPDFPPAANAQGVDVDSSQEEATTEYF